MGRTGRLADPQVAKLARSATRNSMAAPSERLNSVDAGGEQLAGIDTDRIKSKAPWSRQSGVWLEIQYRRPMASRSATAAIPPHRLDRRRFRRRS
jgi:hypothetical protein